MAAPKSKKRKTSPRLAKISHALFTDLMPSTLPSDFTQANADPDADGDTDLALVPDTVQLLPPSGFTGRDGRGPYTYSSDQLIAAFAASGMAGLPIDFEHQSLGAMDKIGPTGACGWISALVAKEDGLYGTVEWNAEAYDLIASRSYRYLSPVFEVSPDKPSEILGMLGAGLTNNPNLRLAAFNSREASAYTKGTETPGETVLKKILEAFGLPADADETTVLAHLVSLNAAVEAARKVAADLGADEGSDAPALIAAAHSRVTVDPVRFVETASFEAMSKRATDAEKALADLKAEAHSKAVTAAVDAAIKAEKFTPGTREQYLAFANTDLAAFEALVAATPVMAIATKYSTVATGDSSAVPAEAAALGLTAEDVAHCKRLKISFKAHAKHKAGKA